MKRILRILVFVVLLSFLMYGCERQKVREGDQSTTKTAAIPPGVYWATYSNIPSKPDSSDEIVAEGPYYLNCVEIGEPSTEELLANVEFTNDNVNCLTYTNPNDHSQYWVERSLNEKGETTVLKVASTAANNFYLRLLYNSAVNHMPALNVYLPRSDSGVHSPDGEVISDPYSDSEKPVAGYKELRFKGSYEDGSEIKEAVEQAGYETSSTLYENGIYSFRTSKELIGRAKIEETLLKPKAWKVDDGGTKGNIGLYNYPNSFTGKITIDYTFSGIPFTIEINDARLDMLEDGEDETNYTLSGTAEISQKSFKLGDLVYRLNDKQQKRFSADYDFKVKKAPAPGVSWDYVETWEYVNDTYKTPFLLTVTYTTRKGPTDFSYVPVADLDKLDGSQSMTFMMPAYGGTATWSFKEVE